MKITSTRLALGFVAALVITSAIGAGFITNNLPVAGGTQYPSTLPLTGLELVPADTQLTQGINPASEAVQVTQVQQGSYATDSTATSHTAAVAAVAGGSKMTLQLTGAPSTAVNLTTPTAALIIAALPSNAKVGYTWTLHLVNYGGTASGVWTVVGGTSVTVSGNATVAVAGSRTYLATWATATTVTLSDIGN